jgi:hypothetical protein
MLDLESEIDRLFNDLRVRGQTADSAETLCRVARQEIITEVSYIIEKFVLEAKEVGIAKSANEFVDQLKVARIGGQYEMRTDSGKTDFTVPPFPMLPKLLKNAKVAKDGSLYKVIPIEDKSSLANKPLTTQEIMNSINKSRRSIKGTGNVKFRVASSKQDANTQWKHPGFERDFTQILHDINSRMGEAIDQTITQITYKYREKWVWR